MKKTVTKDEIVREFAKENGISQLKAEQALDSLVDIICLKLKSNFNEVREADKAH